MKSLNVISLGRYFSARNASFVGEKIKQLPTINFRIEIPYFLDAEGFTIGAELGVQEGKFAKHTLNYWKNCEKFILVDSWRHIPNIDDVCDMTDEEHEKIYVNALIRLGEYKSKIEILRMSTNDAARIITDSFLDYVYLDARHDDLGIWEDMMNFWPKLRSGGIMAVHGTFVCILVLVF